jgi:hypothetical protein
MNYQLGIPEHMRPQRTPIYQPQEECVFCGSTNTTDTISNLVALDATTENQKVCGACLESMQDRQPMVWLRWLKRNNPTHWQRVVSYHRLGTSTLSDVIRRIRID